MKCKVEKMEERREDGRVSTEESGGKNTVMGGNEGGRERRDGETD